MTFTVTILNEHGVWQSADMRLSNPRTRECVDDYSVKHVAFKCYDGSALLTYAGLGGVGDVDISDWIRKFVRGNQFSVDQTMTCIRERATEDLGPLLDGKMRHMFSVGAFLGNDCSPWILQIRNFTVGREMRPGPPMGHFDTLAQQVPKDQTALVPFPNLLSRDDFIVLMNEAVKPPSKPRELSDLLAAVNARTANSPNSRGTVSAHCVTTYMPPAGGGIETVFQGFPSGAPQIATPFLLFGIDSTDMMRYSSREEAEESVRPVNLLGDKLK